MRSGDREGYQIVERGVEITGGQGICREGNVISCDVFSTYRAGKAIGAEEFAVVETEETDSGSGDRYCRKIKRKNPDMERIARKRRIEYYIVEPK